MSADAATSAHPVDCICGTCQLGYSPTLVELVAELDRTEFELRVAENTERDAWQKWQQSRHAHAAAHRRRLRAAEQYRAYRANPT